VPKYCHDWSARRQPRLAAVSHESLGYIALSCANGASVISCCNDKIITFASQREEPSRPDFVVHA
jgi:hypothetical protein